MQQTPARIFASILQEARERGGVSPQDLAESLGLPHHAIRDWERGVRTPRLSSAIKWAQALGFHLELH